MCRYRTGMTPCEIASAAARHAATLSGAGTPSASASVASMKAVIAGAAPSLGQDAVVSFTAIRSARPGSSAAASSPTAPRTIAAAAAAYRRAGGLPSRRLLLIEAMR